jgi:hypothetical protein
MTYILRPLQIEPGVQPEPDSTALNTVHYVDAQGIRFHNGLPQKLGGWESFTFDNNQTIDGCPRNIYSQVIDGNLFTIIGTHTRLYAVLGSQLTNITPLETTTTLIADSLDSVYENLANDPIDSVGNSNVLTINQPGHRLVAGDRVSISGAVAFNGIPAGEINSTHLVRTAGINSYTIFVDTDATATGSGGGAGVLVATSIIIVNEVAHGYSEGDRVKISLSTAFAGITAIEINAEHIIRNVQPNTYDIVVTSFATSQVSGGGGALTEVQGQIPAGDCDPSFGRGYGVGLYGVGLYGVSKTSQNILTRPRIWSFDAFGNQTVLTPGNQTGLYLWDGDLKTAPAIVPNAPTEIDYVYVSDNIVVTLNADGVFGRIKWSGQGNETIWTAGPDNLAGEDDIEGATRFISHVKVRGVNLLFTETQTYQHRFIDKPEVWEIRLIDNSVGIIAQNARVSHGGFAYWMDDENFFMFSGGAVRQIPSNSSNYSTIERFVFEDFNTVEKADCFAWYNKEFNEVWFHYPSGIEEECDKLARFNIKELTWTPDTLSRSAGEYPHQLEETPKLISFEGVLYKHEVGVDDDGSPMTMRLKTKLFQLGNNEMEIGGIYPDSIQTGSLNITIRTLPYPQSIREKEVIPSPVTPTTEHIDFLNTGRNWQYTFDNKELGFNWRMGLWLERVQKGSPE